MIKKTFCLLARWQFDPKTARKGWFARHVKACGDCREFYRSVESLERDLKMTPPPSDDLFCQRIMQEVRGLKSRPVVKAHRAFRPHPALAAAALVVTALIAMVILSPEKERPSESLTQRPEPLTPEKRPTEIEEAPEELPGRETILSVASLIEQQELIRRDAKKLGSHLRERVILFQSTD
jgi:hypothetical protein